MITIIDTFHRIGAFYDADLRRSMMQPARETGPIGDQDTNKEQEKTSRKLN
jgi:hypothetical protein